MKISIIVPIYNIEKYIVECLNSIINQTYKKYEIILVDDGSSDKSGEICDKYAIKNEKIKVIHKKNGGLSDARNSGIDIATGEYIMFVDGDDFLVNKNCLQNIVFELEKEKVDVLQYKMQYYYNSSKKVLHLNDLKEFNNTPVIECLKELNKSCQISISACDKIIKTSVIKDNEIYFKKGINSEDIDWSLRLYLTIKSLKTINQEIYSYRQQRKESITNKVSKKNMRDLFNIINYWYNFGYKNEEIKNIYYNYLAYQYLILVTKSKKYFFDKSEKRILRYYEKELLKYDKVYKVKKVNKLKKIFGFNITKIFLRIYLFLKNKNIYKM